MSLTALLAAATIPLGGAQSNMPREIVARDSFGGQVMDGGLFYSVFASRRSILRRLDLSTGERRDLYTAPKGTGLFAVELGGGTVAFQTDTNSLRHRLFVMDATGGAPQELSRGRIYRRRDCGRDVKLHDVSPSGEVLYESTDVPCPGGTGTRVLRGHHPTTGVRTLRSMRTRLAPLQGGAPFFTLAGNRLLTTGEFRARVRDLAMGTTRIVRSLTQRSELEALDVSPDGRVLAHDWLDRVRRPEEVVRLMDAGEQGRSGDVVHRSRRAFGLARFCGSRPVLFTSTARARFRLTLLDPPAVLAEGRLEEPDLLTTCDDRHYVVTMVAPGRPDRVYVLALPGQ